MFLSVFSDELGYDASKCLPIVKDWGLNYIDFRGSVNGRGIEYQSEEELKALKKQLDEMGLKVGAIQSSLCKVHLPDKERQAEEMEKLEGIIRAADILDCRLVRCFNYWQPHSANPADAGQLAVRPDEMAKVLNMFAPIAKRAKEANLVLAFENCGQTVEEVIALVEALNVPEWGLAWDVSNSFVSKDITLDSPNLVDFCERALIYSRMLHIKAISIVPDLEGDKVPWDRILLGAAATGRDMPVSVETHTPKDSNYTREDCTHECVKLARNAWPSAAPSSIRESLKVAPKFTRSYADNPVRFVVVGLGMGRNRCRQILETEGCELYGVCDLNEAKAKSAGEEFGVKYSTNIEDFLNDPAVEVMYTVVPTGLHAEVSEKCLRAGKHVLTTKPMDVTAEKCQHLIDVAKECGLLLGVDYDMRQSENFLALKKAVDEGWFGHLLSVSATANLQRTQAYYDENGAWRGTWRYDGGGAMCNQGIHTVDQLQALFGMPKRIRASFKAQTHAIEVDDIGYSEWDYGNQLVLRYFATTSYPMSNGYSITEIHGTSGAYVSTSGPVAPGAYYGRDNKWSTEPPYPVEREWRQASDAFASAIRLGTPIPAPGEEGIKARKILDAIYESAKTGGDWVDVAL